MSDWVRRYVDNAKRVERSDAERMKKVMMDTPWKAMGIRRSTYYTEYKEEKRGD